MAEPAVDPEVEKKDGAEDTTEDSAHESTAQFEPVVQLVEVDVDTGETDEECLLKMRGKLYVYGETMLDKGTGNKQWNEKGKGDVKILRHRDNQRIRILMRQEKTMRIICNHFIDYRITMIPNASNDKTWVWTAFDFSDESLAETSFALRLGSADLAQEFKAKFEEAKISNQALMSGANLPTDAAVEEATSAIESLTVKPAEDAKPEESEPEASPEQKQVG